MKLIEKADASCLLDIKSMVQNMVQGGKFISGSYGKFAGDRKRGHITFKAVLRWYFERLYWSALSFHRS